MWLPKLPSDQTMPSNIALRLASGLATLGGRRYVLY